MSEKLTISRWSLIFAHHGIASGEVSRPRDPGEAGNAENASTEFEWVIDPIDGTVNYFYGIHHFCISIALREKSEIIVGVIYDPMRDELWHAELGGRGYLNGKPIEVSQYTEISQSVVSVGMSKTMAELEVDLSIFQDLLARARKCRMMGSAALDLAYVAPGRFDAYIERSVNWWDIAAGVLWSIVPVDGWLSLQAQFKRKTVGDCVERKNRYRDQLTKIYP
jgi:fructose-1,6-bisphosphatase/inositol monophosphatase family enzyme